MSGNAVPMEVDHTTHASNDSATSNAFDSSASSASSTLPNHNPLKKDSSVGDVPMTTLHISDSNATGILSSVQGSHLSGDTAPLPGLKVSASEESSSSNGGGSGSGGTSVISKSVIDGTLSTNLGSHSTSQASDDESDSDSDSDDSADDVPLIQVMSNMSTPVSVKSSSLSSSASSSTINNRTTKVQSSSSKKKKASSNNSIKRPRAAVKRKKQFVDSEDDSDDEDSSSDDHPLIPAAKRELPRYERPAPAAATSSSSKSSSSSSSMSSTRKRSSSSRKSAVSTSRKRAKLNSGNDSSKSVSLMSGFVTKEVYKASDYARKPAVIPLESDKNAVEWWNRLDELSDTIKWQTLDHNGVVFAPEYKPHGVKILYDGTPIELTPEQEEVATMFAVMLETPYATKPKFRENFMKEFRKLLVSPTQSKRYPFIKDLDKCDFTPIKRWYDADREVLLAKRKTKEYRDEMKRLKEESDSLYGYAIVDGIRERVSNYKVEPPGLFRGRGDHPKTGLLKKRLMPEDIILNIGKNTPIPLCPIPGHDWGGIIHDQSVTYIAKWIENINGSHKFVYLHASSRFKGEADVKKYNKARELKKHIKTIRKDYESKLRSKDRYSQQLATAVWIIDRLAIRIGNEKDTDEEADTVGVCSLRVEHIKFHEPISRAEEDIIEAKEQDDAVAAAVAAASAKRKSRKKKSSSNSSSSNSSSSSSSSDDSKDEDDDENNESPLNGGTNNAGCAMQSNDYGGKAGLVYKITLDFLGKDSMRYLQTVIVPGIIYENLKLFCAKKNADHSILEKIDSSQVNTYLKEHMDGLSAKVFRTYNASITLENELSKSFHQQTGQITPDSPIADKIFFYNQCNREVAVLCNHQRSVSKSHESQVEKVRDQINDLVKEIKNMTSELKKSRKIVRNGEKLPMINVYDDDGNVIKKKKMRNPEQLEKAITRKKGQLRKKELDLETKKDNKEIALGTSKINYMDPRVTAAWCKRMEVPIEKVFNKSLLEKFPWAMAVDPDYQF